MLKRIGLLSIGFGLILMFFIFYDYFSFNNEKNKTLTEAEKLIRTNDFFEDERSVNYEDFIHIIDYKSIEEEKHDFEKRERDKRTKERQDYIKNYDIEDGELYGIIKIPEINVESALIEGVDEDDLEVGVGKYSQTGFPGQNQQIFLAGHNNTSFKGMNKLKEGSKIIIEMEYGIYEYRMIKSEIVHESRTDLVGEKVDIETVVLMTCYPDWDVGTDERLLIYAEIVD